MKKHSFKRIKKRLVFRVLPFILAFLMLLTSAPVAVFSTDEKTGESAAAGDIIYDYDTLKITLDGEEISSMSIYPYEKIEISGTGVPENATYQWQIKHPEKNNLWVNIYDAKSDTIGVSAALINNMLTEDGTAKLRLRAYTDDYAYLSTPVTVTLLEEAQPEQTLSVKNITFPHAMAGETSETPEFVTVTIEYVRYDYYKNSDGNYVLDTAGTSAFTSYVATLLYGGNLENQKVVLPTIIGYNAYLCDHSTPDHSVDNNDAEIIKELTLNYTNITENITLQVDYLPANVDYSVRYYFQNIYDDLYVEDTDEKTTTKGPTGSEPDEALMQKPFAGFTPLYHQPDTIAADGSTVFEVYYERNYYLMEFDCAGGYGVETLYVRYGSYISIPDPVKPGYVFEGWDLVKTDNPDNTEPLGDPVLDVHGNETGFYEGDGHENVVDTTMPPYNTAYKALWGVDDTTYTVVYWVDGKYLGSREISSTSSNIVNGDDYKLDSSTIICGTDEHNHTTSGCDIVCGIGEHEHHVHESGCYSYIRIGNEVTNTGDLGAIEAANQNLAEKDEEPKNGYLYLIRHAEWDAGTTRYWPKAYFDGEYYDIYINDSSSILSDDLKNITVDNTLLVEGTSGQYTAYVYKAKNDCGVDACSADCDKAHTHGTTCFGCGVAEHAHDPATCCANELRFMEFSSADSNVTVEGDGSTIVNINYEYKTYTFRFYYAKEVSDKYYVAGGSTWAFSGAVNDVPEQLEDVNGIWGQVEQLPTLTNTDFNENTYDVYTVNGIEGKYYYIELSAKYGTDISTSWPANVFNRVKTSVTHTNGDYAYFSAWNVDANTWYDETYENKTLKGNYQRLDYKLLRHSNYSDSTTLYYLGFWENGTELGDNDWNKPHKWIYNIYIPSTDAEYVHEYDGEKYDLYGTYTLYDDNTSTSTNPYCGQTPTALEGYDVFAHNVSVVEEYDTNYHLYTYQIDFYYKANGPYSFSLYNYNNTIKTENNMFFGVPLSEHKINQAEMHEIHYPDGLEPGAYEFGGWYTTPECFPGTEVNWDTLTMPDGDLTLYAKWTPILRNVTFYTDYNDVPSATNPGGTPFLTATDVPHGSLLGTAYYEIPDKGDEYQFVGWFYMDENNKKRFAPDSMEITRDLVLFAEWQTGIDTEYEVQYKLGENATIGGTTYPAGTVIADTDTAHSSVGKTKTFNAKGAYQLYPAFRKSIFPTVNSHSILMEPDKNDNTFVFEYVYDEKVFYKVRYVDYSTRTEIAASNVKSTDEAIVTEKFLPVSGYMPMPHNYYITKALMTDGYSDGSTIEDENVITFYYIKDTEHGLYSIEYYVENLDSSGAEINASNYETITEQDYHLHQSIVNMADLGATITADIISIDGYEYQTNFVVTYETDGDPETPTTKTPVTAGGVTTITGTDDLDYTGLSIKIYYKRITYPYVIKFVDSYSQDILGYGKLDSAGNIVTNTDGTPKVFASINDINTDEAKFEKTISYTAPATISHDGSLYVLNGEIKKERKIAAETVPSGKTYNDLTNNVIVFYYNQKQVTVKYTAVCKVPGATDFGRTSIGSEIAATISGLGGSEAIELDGYYFAGWYTDKDCTTAVDSSWITGKKIKPQTLDQTKDVIEYYALFKPVSSTLVIKKNVDVTTTDTFLFHIKGTGKFEYVDMVVSIQGSGSVTVNEIPQGTYTITELTDWSWEYDCTSDIKTLTIGSEQATAEFANTANDKNWLNGEAVNENQFN